MPFKIKKTVSGLPPTANSVQFDGVNDYLSLSNGTAFNFGTGNLTIEFWIYFTAVGSGRAVTSWSLVGGVSGTWSVGIGNTSLSFTEVIVGEPGPSATFSSILNTWAHIAVSRSSGTTKLFLNGSQVASAAQTTNFNNTSYPVYVSMNPSIPAYISNLRIVKGTALYTASFTVPTAPLTAITNTSLLTCQSATIIDNSTNNFTITNNNGATVSSTVTPFTAPQSVFKIKKNNANPITPYSVQFSGNSSHGNYATSKYLYTPTNTAFDPSTNTAWTLEFWVYPITTCALLTISTSTNYGNSLWIDWASSQFYWGQGNSAGSNPVYLTTAASYPANNWYHVSICKDSSYISRMFINGTQVLSSTYNGSLGSPNRLIVNGQWDNSGYSYGGNCYVSNLRWIKGTGLYTASFSVPTSPLTAIANTQLLICQSATIIDNSTNNFTITNNNTATVSSIVTPFSASVSNSGFKLKHVSYVRPVYDFTISPAYSGKSTWDLAADGPLILSTSGSWIITPVTSTNTKIKMWGGGGASFKAAWKGGGGGFSSGSVQLEAGIPYRIVTSMNGSNGIIGSGGLTGIFSSSISQANSIMIAGGGGIGTDYIGSYGGNGGAGGGSSGQDGTGNGLQNGKGGTQIAGGSPAVYNSQKAGSALQANGGDGGAGYWGGGAQNAAGSGGGSGYIHPTKVTSGITVTGASSTPANSSDSERSGSAQGSLGNTAGSMGIIIIRAA
jgi:hypothetical protein